MLLHAKIVNFVAPGSGRGFWCWVGALMIAQLPQSLKVLWSAPDYKAHKHSMICNMICIIRKNPSFKIVNFIAPWSGVPVLERGSNDNPEKMN